MRRHGLHKWYWIAVALPALGWLGFVGCQALSDRLTRWNMLGAEALDDPIRAVGGDGLVFSPHADDKPRDRQRLRSASPQELIAYYAPVFVQQRVKAADQRYPYPVEYDQIGEARLRPEGDKYKAYVAGPPRVYAVYEKDEKARAKAGWASDHVQLTYTAWYPAHPRVKAIDLEKGNIDSCVVRVTLDADNVPLFFETIMACGCFHKVFVERRVEDAAVQAFGPPQKGKKYTVERSVEDSIGWEVAGVVEDPPDKPRRPVVFLKAGDHKVIGMGSSARLRVPAGADVRPYELADYSELYAVPVDGGGERKPFFDLGGKVWGAQRKERFLFSFIGVDDAGQPRSLDKIKLHFDQSTWSDPTIYGTYLRLAPGTL